MKKSAIICFLGVDGSGKSTLAKYLCGELKRAQYNVAYIWWLEGEQSLLRKAIKAFGKFADVERGTRHERPNVKRQSTTSRLFRSFYPPIPLLDYLRFGFTHAWLPKIASKDKILIFDRFMYDVILALSEEFEFTEARRKRLFRLCNRLLPKPDLVFIIDVPAELSYSRKKDEIRSVREAEEKRESYRELGSLLETFTSARVVRIDNSRDVAEAKAEILKETLAFIEGDSS
jgi:thymidylate kinase